MIWPAQAHGFHEDARLADGDRHCAGAGRRLRRGRDAPAAGTASPRPEPRTVLLLQSARSTTPAALLMTEAFRRELDAVFPDSVDLHVEYLALTTPADPTAASSPASCARSTPGARSTSWSRSPRGRSSSWRLIGGRWPRACRSCTRRSPGGRAILTRLPNATGVSLVREGQPSLRLALELHPGTRQVILVAGAGPQDLAMARSAQDQLVRAPVPDLGVESLAGQPLEAQLDRLSRLPPHTVVLFVDYAVDSRGRTVVARDILRRVTAVSSAPVYGASETYLGYGIVGGDLIRFGRLAEEAASLAARVLKGEAADAIPTVRTSSSEIMFDWRELRRWGIPESRLPKRSVVLFREPDLWSEHGGRSSRRPA